MYAFFASSSHTNEVLMRIKLYMHTASNLAANAYLPNDADPRTDNVNERTVNIHFGAVSVSLHQICSVTTPVPTTFTNLSMHTCPRPKPVLRITEA